MIIATPDTFLSLHLAYATGANITELNGKQLDALKTKLGKASKAVAETDDGAMAFCSETSYATLHAAFRTNLPAETKRELLIAWEADERAAYVALDAQQTAKMEAERAAQMSRGAELHAQLESATKAAKPKRAKRQAIPVAPVAESITFSDCDTDDDLSHYVESLVRSGATIVSSARVLSDGTAVVEVSIADRASFYQLFAETSSYSYSSLRRKSAPKLTIAPDEAPQRERAAKGDRYATMTVPELQAEVARMFPGVVTTMKAPAHLRYRLRLGEKAIARGEQPTFGSSSTPTTSARASKSKGIRLTDEQSHQLMQVLALVEASEGELSGMAGILLAAVEEQMPVAAGQAAA